MWMAKVGFIGVGNMGGPMARNLIKAGHRLKVFDISENAVIICCPVWSRARYVCQDAAKGVAFVVTILPVGDNVRQVFLENGIIGVANTGTVFIDASTIDIGSAIAAQGEAKAAGFE